MRLFTSVILIYSVHLVFAKITDEEYASMPDLFHFDNYDKCMLHGQTALYCTLQFQLYPINSKNTTKIWKIIKEVNSKPSNYRHDWLRYGICINDTCPNVGDDIKNELIICYNNKFEKLGLMVQIDELHCINKNSSYPIDVYDITVGLLFILYMLWVIAATSFEYLAVKYKTNEQFKRYRSGFIGKFLAAFSIIHNFKRLSTTDTERPAFKTFKCIQGIRFYNMICVILAHTALINLAMPTTNPLFSERMTQKTFNMFLLNGGYAVETYFLISAWLLTYQMFTIFDGKREIRMRDLISAFIYSLTPAILVMIAFHSTWLIHVSNGPFWNHFVGTEYERCRKNWWTNILFINNYVHNEDMCLPQTWYTATDTQLFVMALIVITLMIKYPKLSKLILGTIVTLGLAIPFILSYLNDYDIVVRQYPESLYYLLLKVSQWHTMCTSTLTNICGYAIGITFGYIFYKNKDIKLKITKWNVVLWWLLGYGLCIFIILIATKFYQNDYIHNKLEAAFYWAFGRSLFAFGIGIVIYGMILKLGWFTLWFCEWKPAVILGRLSYSAYVIHLTLIIITRASQRMPLYLSEFQIIVAALGDIALAFLGATVLCLFIELPMSALQKLFCDNFRQNKKNIVSNI